MYMEDKKRKSSRSFELEKGSKRSFDLQKTSARKFDLEKDSDEVSLEELKKDLLANGKIDAEEVNKLREVLFADGKIDQEEADFLFEINDAVSGKPNDSSWKAFFVEAISDYLLNDEKSPGVIDEKEGKWLEAKINNDGKLDTVERALVASLRRKSKSMPKSLSTVLSQVASRFNLKKDEVPAVEAATALAALAATKAKASRFSLEKENNDTAIINIDQLKKEILDDGKIDREEVERLRKTLYADGKIDHEEADFLFELNDAVSGKKNDPAWNQFFVQAISDYLLKDERSPGVIDEDEGRWLVEKIGADGQVDGVEKQLLDNLKKNAKKMPAAVTTLITSAIATKAISTENVNYKQLKKELIADGKIDKEEVERLRKTLYADGKIDQEEADFLFELNDAVSGKKNDPAWNQFFVQAISDYLLKDERSPGVIDENEGRWLVEKIGADGKVDGVEKQLLNNLKKNAKKMPPVVTALLNGDAKTPDSTSANIEEPKSRKLLWILLAVVVAAIIGYFCMKSCDGNKEDQPTEQVASGLTGENARQATPKDSITDNTNGRVSSVADDGGEDKAGSQASDAGGNSIEPVKTQSEETTATQKSSEVPNGSDNNQNTPKNNLSASSNQQTAPVRPASPTKSAISTKPVSINSQQLVPIGSVEETARKVIRGIYGNGIERKRNLGDRYAEIQSIVNEMYRKGLVR